MKRKAIIFILASFLAGSTPLFAVEAKEAPQASTAPVPHVPDTTIFNRLSNFFSEFDKTYARRGNKQGFWDATASWMRNINKQ